MLTAIGAIRFRSDVVVTGTSREVSMQRNYSLAVGLLLAVLIVFTGMSVCAQGWASGARVSRSAAGAKAKANTKGGASKVTKTKINQPAKVAATRNSSAKRPAAVKTNTNSGSTKVATKSVRERTVTESKGAKATDAGGTAANKSPELKSGESVRVGFAGAPKPGRCDPDQDDRTDLSGTYVGKVNYPNNGLSGDATLTVNGNRFTLRSGSRTESGNITAVTTCSYTAVAMMFGEWKTPQPGEVPEPPLPMLSLRALRQGDRLTLKASPSERLVFSFEPAADKQN
jgi:hypothetical protein